MIDVNFINDVTFATSFRGYDKDEVDNFLEELAKMAEDSNSAASEAERKVAELAAKCRKLESAGASGGAEAAADDGERDRIIAEANAESERIIAEAKKTLESARAKERAAAQALARANAGESADAAVAGAAVQEKFEGERTTAAAKQEAIKILTEAKERAKAHTEAANVAIKNAIATAKQRIEAADKAAQERAQTTERVALERRHVDTGGARPLRIAQIDALLPRRRRRHHRHRAAIRLREQVRQLLHGEQNRLGRIRRDHHLGIARRENKRVPATRCGDGDSRKKCARYGRSQDNSHLPPSAQTLDRKAFFRLPPERLFKMQYIISCAPIKSEKE